MFDQLMISGLLTGVIFVAIPPTLQSEGYQKKRFSLSTSVFVHQGNISTRYTCEGENLSPPLHWIGGPEGTQSFVLICKDIDAPSGAFIHWILYNIPASFDHLEKGFSRSSKLPDGTMQGVNSFGNVGYDGPCPPKGKPHRYIFTLYALDTVLNCDPQCSYQEILRELEGHVIDQVELVGLYEHGPHEVQEAPKP